MTNRRHSPQSIRLGDLHPGPRGTAPEGPDQPRGVVFDLDGTLVPSHHDFRKMQDAIISIAVRTGARERTLVATESVGTSQILSDARRELIRAEVSTKALARFHEEVAFVVDAIEMTAGNRTTLRRGAKELLEYLKGQGYRLGLFTRASGPFCVEILTRIRIQSRRVSQRF
ncbi:MAG TPA: HAD family hydrolase [Thermoplasmata archaeon]|nr:HAD family hydrolase [Thermoplasmata archaeon]